MCVTDPAISSRSCPAWKSTGAGEGSLRGWYRDSVDERAAVAVLGLNRSRRARRDERPCEGRQAKPVFVDSNTDRRSRGKRQCDIHIGAIAAHAGDGDRVLLLPLARRVEMPATNVHGFQ